MAKNSILEFDETPSNNTDVGGISITGNSNVANFDDGLRELMSQMVKQLLDDAGDNTVAGTADVITITTKQTVTQYKNGVKFGFIPSGNNTVTAVTANIDGLGAKKIKQFLDGAEAVLAIDDLKSGGLYTLIYRADWDGGSGAFQAVDLNDNASYVLDIQNDDVPFSLYKRYTTNHVVINDPEGSFDQIASTQTGAYKITLPVLWTEGMISIEGVIKSYEGVVRFHVGGYLYNGISSWYKPRGYALSDHDNSLSLRFGHDGTNACIWIGETTDSWTYSSATVDRLTLDLAADDAEVADFSIGWASSIESTFDTVQFTLSDNKIGVDGGGGGGAPDAVLEDQKPSGTNGGSATSGGWYTRTLNTIVKNTDSALSLSSSKFTPSVDGYVRWQSQFYKTNRTTTKLYNFTDSVTAGVGTPSYTDDNVIANSFGGAFVEAGKEYAIQSHCDVSYASTGFGVYSGQGEVEVYSILEFWRS